MLYTKPNLSCISIFSGCGGLDIGALNAGIDVIFSTDIMPNAIETLKTFHQGEVIHSDIREISSFPKADMLIGGYPCQSFSMGGRRKPDTDSRSELYTEFARALSQVQPKYFVAENVPGLRQIDSGKYLYKQLDLFSECGIGYNISYSVLNSADYGVPQKRKRLFIVGVRKDLFQKYEFPKPTHGDKLHLIPFVSHGEVIKELPLWPTGEFYEAKNKDSTFSWYYMSRNRKAKWYTPSYTIVANWRHTTLHPASPAMSLTWSNLKDGHKQRWDFSNEYEHLTVNKNLPVLDSPRRLSWRECAVIQSFPRTFEPSGTIQNKFTQIGNAVPPILAQAVFEGITKGTALINI